MQATMQKQGEDDNFQSDKDMHLDENTTLNVSLTWGQLAIRFVAVYLFPIAVVFPISLLLSLNTLLLQPLFNSVPLQLHTLPIYAVFTIFSTWIFWITTRYRLPRTVISAKVCFCVSALAGELSAVSGRHVGNWLGQNFGPEWGSVAARVVLGLGSVSGSTMFALLCFDHGTPLVSNEKENRTVKRLALTFIVCQAVAYNAHIWLGERFWNRVLTGSTSALAAHPERGMLSLSLLLTLLSLFVRPDSQSNQARRTSVNKPGHQQLLSSSLFFFLLVFRLPIVFLAMRQQLFLRPSGSFIAANGQLKVHSSLKGISGQVVVGDNLQDEYRFLRCDHSILGGMWMRHIEDAKGVVQRTDLGDSIFATFPLQEVVILTERPDMTETAEHTIEMVAGSQLAREATPDTPMTERALIIGLGAGIVASSFARRGLHVDVVEYDPVVYRAAMDYFNLATFPPNSIHLMDGAKYVENAARLYRQGMWNETRWTFVVHDCFTGGKIPAELYTLEFWEDLQQLLAEDGLVAMTFSGLPHSLVSRSVILTLISVFQQCRAFRDGLEDVIATNSLVNMVFVCTNSLNPILSFRSPTPTDVLHSPLRSHIFSTFHRTEISFESIIQEKDWDESALILRRGQSGLDYLQKDAALAAWEAMQSILSPVMWLAY